MNEEIPWYDPEDCEVCGFPANQFGDTDVRNGCWVCPDCGQPQ